MAQRLLHERCASLGSKLCTQVCTRLQSRSSRLLLQEDAAAIGLSVLSGAHLTVFARVVELLAQNEMHDVIVCGGGIIPADDIVDIERMGVTRIFTPGASTRDIVDFAQKSILREAGQLSIPEQPKEALK